MNENEQNVRHIHFTILIHRSVSARGRARTLRANAKKCSKLIIASIWLTLVLWNENFRQLIIRPNAISVLWFFVITDEYSHPAHRFSFDWFEIPMRHVSQNATHPMQCTVAWFRYALPLSATMCFYPPTISKVNARHTHCITHLTYRVLHANAP